jgi:hypothetical protein
MVPKMFKRCGVFTVGILVSALAAGCNEDNSKRITDDGSIASGSTDAGNGSPADVPVVDAVTNVPIVDAANVDTAVPVPGANGGWSRIGPVNQADQSTFQNLCVAANAAGDAAMVWQLYPGVLQATIYSHATDKWSAVKTFEVGDSLLSNHAVKVLGDGTVALAWLEILKSGESMKLRMATSINGQWTAANDITSLDANVSAGISQPEFVADDLGNVAIAWRSTIKGPQSFSQSFVATRSAGAWQVKPLGAFGVGPPKLALDKSGVLHVLYSGALPATTAPFYVLATKYDFVAKTWSDPVSLKDDAYLYDCRPSLPCYGVSAGKAGAAVAVIWAGNGSDGTKGAITGSVYNGATALWTSTGVNPLGLTGAAPQTVTDGFGNSTFVYSTVSNDAKLLMQSRKFTSATSMWAASESLPLFNMEDTKVNGSGELLVVGSAQGQVPGTTSNVGAGWSQPRLVDDFKQCTSRQLAGALDDQGVALLGQICSTSGGLPMFIRSARFSIR